jgi:anti-sigma factor RsiW
MTGCSGAKRLTAYHDDELSPEERREVEAHLARCEACARELAELRALSGVLAGAKEPVVPDGMVGRVRGRLERAAQPEIVRLCRRVALAAAAVLVVCAAWLWQSGDGAAPGAAPAAWEVAAVTLDEALAQEGQAGTFAVWMVSDLSRENGW